ncbi:MAG: orotate phosphoribosyltransferase [bacterium]|nr:orotate phosphoribosyltransferase [bacterium]
MDQEKAIHLLKESGALLKGHFILTSGLHSDQYVEKFRLLEQPYYCELFAKDIAEYFRNQNPTIVVGPAMGGILLAYEVARHLGTKMAFPERVDGKFTFRRGFQFQNTDRVLLVEDIVTTGGSLLEVIETLKSQPSTIIGIGLICDRSQGKAKFPFETYAVCTLDINAWKEDELPEFLKSIPPIKPGSRNLTN